MRWFFRIVLTLAIGCLAVLATLPYLGPLEQGWKDFLHAWELVRSDKVDPSETQAKDQPIYGGEPTRSREVVIPEPETETAESFAPEDSFLTEARARANADPEAAMNWLQAEASSTERLRGMLEVVAIWAAQDSENALLWLETNAQGIARHETIHSGIELWSREDPLAAATWVEGMANDGSKSTAAQTLASNWAVTNPAAAAKWIGQLPPGLIRNDAAGAYVDSLMITNPDAAADWAVDESIRQGNYELWTDTISNYTTSDPEGTLTYIRSLENTAIAERAVTAHLETMAETDPNAAAEWIASLSPADPLYNDELGTILLREWSRSDSVAASTWLSEAQSGPKRDAAIIGFAETMIDYEPAAVAAWTNTISDPQTRVNWLTHAVQTWARTKPVETLRWLKEVEIDPALRTQLAREVGAD